MASSTQIRNSRYSDPDMATVAFAAPWVEFESLLGTRPILRGRNVEDLIKQYEALGSLLVSKLTFPAAETSVKAEDRQINNDLKVRIYTPAGYVNDSRPIGVFIHGGGWAMGDLNADDTNCREICKGAGVVLVSVDYRLAPQHPYPAGFDDCVAAFEWAVKNAKTLGGVSGKAFIAGISAGAGSAIGLALRIVDDGKADQLAGVVAQIPVTVHPDDVPEKLRRRYTSYDDNSENTINSKSAMLGFWDAYDAPAKDKYTNPLLHPELSQLPNVYMSCCGQDTLRDDARLMRDALKEARVAVSFDEYPGYPHYFWTFPAPSLKEPSEEYYGNLVKGVEFVLS